MNDARKDANRAPEYARNLTVVGSAVAVALLAYAFAAGGWNLAGEMPLEGDFASSWHRMNAPAETDLARRH